MACLRSLVLSFAAIPAVPGLNVAAGPNIYLEVATPKGSDVSAVESQLLKKYSPSETTYRLSEESRITQGDAYKTQVLNLLSTQINGQHDFCSSNLPCIQSFIEKNRHNQSLYATLGYMYAEMQSKGCLQAGGCRAEFLGTLNWHVEHGHNVLVESGLMDAGSVKDRLSIVRRSGFQSVLVVVADSFQQLTVKHAPSAMSLSVQEFMMDPQGHAGPVLMAPGNVAPAVQDFTCNMYQMLECMPGAASAPGGPCELNFDAVYVVDRTQGSEVLQIAMKGCSPTDPGFLGAKAALKRSLPTGAPMCGHGVPMVRSFFR